MSLTNDDLHNMRKIVKEEVTVGFSVIWEDNLEPNMVVKQDLADTELRLNKQLQDTRDLITKKAVEVGGASVQRGTTLNTKTDTVAHKLEEKNVFSTSDTEDIRRISPIAVSPTS